ncbi:MAG: recombination-associated protein RdgC [Gammaproteobacteria bacterium]|uniref:recombination-associated protein RdgC n=1 Tax=Acidovorax sp. JG5 TaxID=2822718 RepID=UPI001B333E2D|nr:recombination-associated protein RdgC [Acidovorax sp. JG5]MBU4422996.1 recombination-associated protein RdgC [Gammaproteobacteria bacterium]
MFKNMIVYRIAPQWQVELTQVEEALAKAPFLECGATQEKSLGWVPPRGDAHGPLAESVGGQWILRFMVESKVLPGSVLARRVKEKAERIEQETGRKPGKKESKELKDEAKLDLLPMAFTKQGSMWVWIDTASRLLVLDTSAQGRADEVVTLLVESLPGLSVSLINTQTSPQAAMSHWLSTQEPPVGFTVDRECELKSADEAKAVVRYARHPLDIEEVQAHIAAGKLPTKLAMTWDDRVSFMLTEGLQIKKVAFLDTVFEGTKADDGGFDTDVAIATGELVKLIPDLIEALGGEAESGVAESGVASAAQAMGAGAAPAAAPVPQSAPSSAPSAPARKSAGGGVVTGPVTPPEDTDPESAPF